MAVGVWIVWGLLAATAQAQAGPHDVARKITIDPDTALIVVTDMEPDDRIALQLLAANVPPGRIAVAGTTVLHAQVKLALARRLFDQIGYGTAPLCQGHGGEPAAYQPYVRSTAPARSFEDEGRDIFAEAELERLRAASKISDALARAIARQLLDARRPTEIILLAPPTDLMAALAGMDRDEHARALRNIRRIHVMGGWSIARDGTLRTTYNWSMAPRESRALMDLDGVEIVLYSSHAIRPVFAWRSPRGDAEVKGSVNRDTAPRLWPVVEGLTPTAAQDREPAPTLPSLGDGLIAQRYWDQTVIDHYPEVGAQIGRYAGHQFTPADPFVVVGALDAQFIRADHVRPVRVTLGIGEGDLDPNTGYRVTVVDDPRSRVLLVDAFDKAEFETFAATSLTKLRQADPLVVRRGGGASTARWLVLAALALAAGLGFRRRRAPVTGRGTPCS